MDRFEIDSSSDRQNKTILVPPHIEIRELAEMLQLKPFHVVAEVLQLKQFKRADDMIDFSTAATVAQKHGYLVGRSN